MADRRQSARLSRIGALFPATFCSSRPLRPYTHTSRLEDIGRTSRSFCHTVAKPWSDRRCLKSDVWRSSAPACSPTSLYTSVGRTLRRTGRRGPTRLPLHLAGVEPPDTLCAHALQAARGAPQPSAAKPDCWYAARSKHGLGSATGPRETNVTSALAALSRSSLCWQRSERLLHARGSRPIADRPWSQAHSIVPQEPRSARVAASCRLRRSADRLALTVCSRSTIGRRSMIVDRKEGVAQGYLTVEAQSTPSSTFPPCAGREHALSTHWRIPWARWHSTSGSDAQSSPLRGVVVWHAAGLCDRGRRSATGHRSFSVEVA